MGEKLSHVLKPNILKGAAVAAAIGSTALPSIAEAHSLKEYDFTGYKVAGPTSTFGPPAEGAGQTADGGTDARPCIAIRNDSTLDHKFLVEVLYQHIWHEAVLPHCDWGPGILYRAIDISGYGEEEFKPPLPSPANYPTGAWGVARELASSTLGARLSFPGRAVMTFGNK
jgi:hypothetical protein